MLSIRAVLTAGLIAFGLLAALTWSLTAAPRGQPATVPNDLANVRINEFMADNSLTLHDPDEPDEAPDWIELYNPGPDVVSLQGLALSDDPNRPSRHVITTGLTIPAGGFLLFYADNDPEQGAYHLNFALSRNGGFVSLFNTATETLIDSHSYAAQSADVSEGRQSDGGEPWRSFNPSTPGATNSLLPPVISNVQQTPDKPTATVTVTITATVLDERGVAGVSLFYSTTASGPVEVSMVATGNVYAGQIPPFADQTLVRYYLIATDIDDLQARAPQTAPRQPFRYIVGFTAPLIYVNEFMANNEGALVNPDQRNPNLPGYYPDWLELYNPTTQTVSLDGLFLTDHLAEPTQFAIPSGLTIAPRSFIVFYADKLITLGPLHTNFNLDRGGEYVAIYANAELPPIDAYEYGETLSNTVWSRSPDGSNNWVLTACVTPGSDNCTVRARLPLVASQ